MKVIKDSGYFEGILILKMFKMCFSKLILYLTIIAKRIFNFKNWFTFPLLVSVSFKKFIFNFLDHLKRSIVQWSILDNFSAMSEVDFKGINLFT